MVRLFLSLAACAAYTLADGKLRASYSSRTWTFWILIINNSSFQPHLAIAIVTFNVVGFRDDDGDMFGVSINGKVTKLTTTIQTYPLWSANVPGVNGPLEYKYVQLSAAGETTDEEEAKRKLPAGAIHTPNEFFGRTQSIHTLPPLPQVYENKLEQNSPFFREGYVASIFLEGDAAKFNYMNKGGAEFHPPPYKVKVRYIGQVHGFDHCSVTSIITTHTNSIYSNLA